MARYQVILAYDGTQFAGFQRLHATGKRISRRTVQGDVETALRRMGWIGQSILSAGRTDTGVHASGQVIAFDLDWKHSPQELGHALNAYLPEDIGVRSVGVVADDFHPRYAARSRRYSYQIFCQPERNPLRERYAWRVWPPVDLQLLSGAAELLAGTHDFVAFGIAPHHGGSTRRTVLEAGWTAQPPASYPEGNKAGGWRFEIKANAFLYHMVRRLVFTQVQVGQNRLPLKDLSLALETGNLPVKGLAPARGLVLVEVNY
jgi:tRNA pseudouridine38-40 synthase